MSDYLHKELTYKIIGAAMEVHKQLGSGFLESVYQSALAHELSLNNIPYEEQYKIDVGYKNKVVGFFKADFLVDGKVIVEIKATKGLIEIDGAQLINYLKATGIRVGLLINFGKSSLETKRRIY